MVRNQLFKADSIQGYLGKNWCKHEFPSLLILTTDFLNIIW